jgi:hypothetical protein
MGNSLIAVIVNIGMVTLTVSVTRWVFASKGPAAPKRRGQTSIYGIKPAIRVVGFVSALFFCAIPVCLREDVHSAGDWALVSCFVIAALGGVWIASGSITTDGRGIVKNGLWSSKIVPWEEVTGIHLDEKKEVITLHAGRRQLVVDSRFAARESLFREIVARTGQRPTS